MKTITREYKVYNFDELSKETQQKVIEKNYDINVDYEWYDYLVEEFKEDMEKAGIEFEHLYWSIDRDYFMYMDKPYISDIKKLLKAYKKDSKISELTLSDVKDLLNGNYQIYTQHYAGSRAKNYFDNDFLTEWLENKFSDLRSQLKKEYDYLTSEEGIIETIEANDYTFLEDGTMFN